MASDNLERTLRDGIEAARRGDKLTARRLLQQVLQQDRTNEAALMWMASVVDTQAEKRAYLEQVLRINPANDRARQALERMGGAPPPSARSTGTGGSSSTPPRPAPPPKSASRRRGLNKYFVAAIIVAILMGVGLLLLFLTPPPEPAVVAATPTTAAIAMAEATVGVEASETPAPLPTAPGVLVTLDPAQDGLPATFTPTFTPEPSVTPTPSATPLPLSTYRILFAAAKPGEVTPSLFAGLADGSGIREIGDTAGYYDIALSPDKTQIAFVRNIAAEGSAGPDWQLFVAPLSDPTEARQITNTLNSGMEHPVWANDGLSLVFAANYDGDLDLFRISANPDGDADPTALTTNEATDSYPAFPPAGDSLLFVSDLNTPGFPRLYTMNPSGVVRAFSNLTGILSDPVYSPDGGVIAYVNQQSSDPDIFTVNAEGLRPVQLSVNDSAVDRALAWSDDGRWIAFASDRINGRFMIYLLNVDTREIVPLRDLAEAQSIAFLPE